MQWTVEGRRAEKAAARAVLAALHPEDPSFRAAMPPMTDADVRLSAAQDREISIARFWAERSGSRLW